MAMEDRYGVLLQKHGPPTTARPSPRHNSRSVYLESLCRIYWEAKTLGEPRLLTAVESDAVAGAVSAYGRSVLKS